MIRAQTEGVSNATELTVVQQPNSITVSPGSKSLSALGDTVRLSATIADRNAHEVEGATATWLSTAPLVASVDGTGRVTAEGDGLARVIAAAGALRDTAEINVAQAVDMLVVSPGADTLTALSDTIRFAAVLWDKNGNAVTDASITWISTQPTVVSVDADGLATANTNGDARVVATSGTKSDTAFVSVSQQVASVSVTPQADTLPAVGDTIRMVAALTDRAGASVEGHSANWISTDEAVVTVDSEGLVTAVSNGTATVIGTAGTAADSASITVAQSVETIVVAPDTDTLTALTDTVRLGASLYDRNGNPVTDAAVTWTSGAPSYASVSPGGLVTAIANGPARIKATSGAASDSALIIVSQDIASIVVTPTNHNLTALGETLQLTAEISDRLGQPVEGQSAEWTSTSNAVVSVDAGGLATGISFGTAGIIGTVGVLADTSVITVSDGPPPFPGWAQMSVDWNQSCGVTLSGDAYCWGRNDDGQLGDGTNTDRNVPTPLAGSVSGLVTWVQVDPGHSHACGVTASGKAYCWGRNDSGQLGNGTGTNSSVPVAVANPGTGPVSWVSLSAGGSTTCGITTNGDAYCWGLRVGAGSTIVAPLRVTDPADGAVTWTSINVGAGHACGVAEGGNGYCWGNNGRGQLGDGTDDDSSVPVELSDPAFGPVRWEMIDAGSDHTCGVTTDGWAHCWGENAKGQLGDGTTTDRNVPTRVAYPSTGFVPWVSVSAGASSLFHGHTCGLTVDAEAYCWGSDSLGKLGNNTYGDSWVPYPVNYHYPDPVEWVSISAGQNHSGGLKASGDAYLWGYNMEGQIGDGTYTTTGVPVAAVEP
jgi:alpha-tubulin suppressor-like RCC1 family protein